MFLISEEYILSVGRTEEKFILTREIRCISFDLTCFIFSSCSQEGTWGGGGGCVEEMPNKFGSCEELMKRKKNWTKQ